MSAIAARTVARLQALKKIAGDENINKWPILWGNPTMMYSLERDEDGIYRLYSETFLAMKKKRSLVEPHATPAGLLTAYEEDYAMLKERINRIAG